MKYILSVLAILLVSFSFFSNTYGATNSIFSNGAVTKPPYCDNNECGLEKGVEAIKDIDDIEKNKKASEFVQDLTEKLLGYITILSVLMIVGAGVYILLSAGDEEKAKKSKSVIISVIIGILIIWLAYPIVKFILSILQ